MEESGEWLSALMSKKCKWKSESVTGFFGMNVIPIESITRCTATRALDLVGLGRSTAHRNRPRQSSVAFISRRHEGEERKKMPRPRLMRSVKSSAWAVQQAAEPMRCDGESQMYQFPRKKAISTRAFIGRKWNTTPHRFHSEEEAEANFKA